MLFFFLLSTLSSYYKSVCLGHGGFRSLFSSYISSPNIQSGLCDFEDEGLERLCEESKGHRFSGKWPASLVQRPSSWKLGLETWKLHWWTLVGGLHVHYLYRYTYNWADQLREQMSLLHESCSKIWAKRESEVLVAFLVFTVKCCLLYHF